MKILNSNPISAFGGINFVLKELADTGIDTFLEKELPKLPRQSKYGWKDIFFSYWSVLFCGGDCAEDIATNLKNSLKNTPFVKLPSPDRLLGRLKILSEPSEFLRTKRGQAINEFSYNRALSDLNLKLLKKLGGLKNREIVLDYDNTFVYNKKSDAKRTYTKDFGYCPGIGLIGNKVVYVENRNGNCAPHTLQEITLGRMFKHLRNHKLKINAFRADSATYQLSTINIISENVDRFYVKAVINETTTEAIRQVTEWKEVKTTDGRSLLRGTVIFTPFKNAAERLKLKDSLREYRLVVTKEERRDGQTNLFTGEAYNYSPILTNDFEKSDDDIVFFYNKRGTEEREFDVLKNDFGWNKLPFSKLEQNTVYLILTAMCRNIYDYIILKFSKRYKTLKENFRIKKFIFRFICIPAKWIVSGRQTKLRLYGQIAGVT